MKLTVQTLINSGLSQTWISFFEKLYPSGMELTEENAVAAAKAGFDICRIAQQTLKGRVQDAYMIGTSAAWRAYANVLDVRLRAQMDLAPEAREVYAAAEDAAWKVFMIVAAKAFVAALLASNVEKKA